MAFQASVPDGLPSRSGVSTPPTIPKKSLKDRSPAWKTVIKAIIPTMFAKRQSRAWTQGSGGNDGKRRKSFSNPENIENFAKDTGSHRLEEEIKLHHLEQLMQEFKNHRPADVILKTSGYFPTKVEKRVPGCMNLEEFQAAIATVLGSDEYDHYLEKLFSKLDTSCDGYVDWNEFCTYMLLMYRENDYLRTKKEIPFLVEPKIRHVVSNKQETTTKVISTDNPTRYFTISKEGAIGVWSSNLVFLKSYNMGEDNDDPTSQKRRVKMWVTDAILLPNCHKLAIATTSRDIHFFDVSTNQHFEEFNLFGLIDIPHCMDYWYSTKSPSSQSLLVVGMDSGAVHLLYFLKPTSQLFETSFQSHGGVQKIFTQDLPQHAKFVRSEILPDIHPEIVSQVRYLPENDSIISCSSSPRSSVVISDAQKIKKTYTFRMEKGAECFDHNKNLNILVTGSANHLVRLWNPYVTSKYIAILPGHMAGVIGVIIHEGLGQVFSYSKDAVIKVWDIKEQACLQTVILKFPGNLHGRIPDHGPFPMHLQLSPHNSLLVTCSDYLGLLKMGTTGYTESNTGPVTHDTQLCCAVYNQLFKQVVSGCDASAIAVWDIETGNKAIVFSNAHGDEEITAMLFDESWRRLITGARNGSIKVWNFQNGHNLHKLESAAGESEVTGLVQLSDKKVFLAVGWSQLITLYDDSDPDNLYIGADNNWKGGQLHHDDILTVAHCPPNMLATASFDGEILVWLLETEKLFVRLRKGKTNIGFNRMLDPERSSLSSRSGSSCTSRPNSRHRTSHRVSQGYHAPVDKLLFLRARVAARNIEGAVLVSSEAGTLRWWSIYGTKKELGYFYAPDTNDESVLSMCTKPNNSILVTGDTQGVLKIWSIMDYCVRPQERRVTAKPVVECMWQAHDGAVVSVEYIEHESGVFLLTASVDKTAKLWNLQGQLVGIFGQKRPWNLKIKGTWAYRRAGWGKESSSNTGNSLKVPNKHIPTVDINAPADVIIEVENQEETTPEPARHKSGESKLKTIPSVKNCVADSIDGAMRLRYRSQTFTIGSGSDMNMNNKTFLGLKVEQDFARIKNDRKGRRDNFGEIDTKQTSRFGKICSPFHALATPRVEEIRLPDNLPLSQRMISRGYTSMSLTPEKINDMDFSIIPSTPFSEEQTDPASGQMRDTSTPRLPALKPHNRPSRHTGQVLSFKKHATVM